ncbi:SAM-dependent methyltransferase [Amycolatopsis carbonis]|uniref:S-adenosyl-L-methionine-dependent methyltransferase n=1 Tax=Amycolatopsis carbonis TaxID=715471 RepID=A0A9Y2IG97_9PSEU|nr:SAM-dependent methyltransferase [Amycolatopsis sp. 2-15]WIX79805.1 SAM-dependent methyltransferase [Amycolatopsis sp. 2-15]
MSATALMIAAARAIETNRPDGLVHDEWAERFVRAAEPDLRLPTRIEDVELGDADPVWGRGGAYSGLRTRAFDDFLLAASSRVDQIALLGSGLDTRAWRLDLPVDLQFFELDRADVLGFKRRVLAGAAPRPRHEFLVADLAEDWAKVLTDAGFDPAQPTAWLVEGVLPYLSGAAEARLMAHIHRLSAPGSELGYEIVLGQEAESLRTHDLYTATGTSTGTDIGALFDDGTRPDSAANLRAAGWTVTSAPVADFTTRYGRGPDPAVVDPITQIRWVIGSKPLRTA